jgi:hypothetical protein
LIPVRPVTSSHHGWKTEASSARPGILERETNRTRLILEQR